MREGTNCLKMKILGNASSYEYGYIPKEESSSAITTKSDNQLKLKARAPLTPEQIEEIDKRRQHGYFSLKFLKSLHGVKVYFCLPNLSREDKLHLSKNITENGGVIKASLSNAGNSDNSNESLKEKFNHFTDRNNKISGSMNYIANECKILKVLNTSTYKDMSLCEGRFTSRMKKLMQAPVKQAPVMPSCEETYTDLYSILSDEKFKIVTMSDLINIINRMESWRNSKEWFKPRIYYSVAEPNGADMKSYFCIASFEKQKQQLYNEILYLCELHEFSYNFKAKCYCDIAVNVDAPQGTSVFQTRKEYEFAMQNRDIFTENFAESLKCITNKTGGMGKDVKYRHKEPKPIDSKYYDEIDNICDSLMQTSSCQYPSFKKVEVDTKPTIYIDDATKDYMLCDSHQTQINQDNKEPNNEGDEVLESSSIQQNTLLLLVEESNKDISNRIKTYKNTPNKFVPYDQLIKGMTPIYHKQKRNIGSAMKRTLLFDDKPTESIIDKEINSIAHQHCDDSLDREKSCSIITSNNEQVITSNICNTQCEMEIDEMLHEFNADKVALIKNYKQPERNELDQGIRTDCGKEHETNYHDQKPDFNKSNNEQPLTADKTSSEIEIHETIKDVKMHEHPLQEIKVTENSDICDKPRKPPKCYKGNYKPCVDITNLCSKSTNNFKQRKRVEKLLKKETEGFTGNDSAKVKLEESKHSSIYSSQNHNETHHKRNKTEYNVNVDISVNSQKCSAFNNKQMNRETLLNQCGINSKFSQSRRKQLMQHY